MVLQGFLSNVPVKLQNIQDLRADPDKLYNYLLKASLLGEVCCKGRATEQTVIC